MTPRDFTFNHITINTGYSRTIQAFDGSCDINKAVAFVRNAIDTERATILNTDIIIHPKMESLAFGNDCAIWEIRNPLLQPKAGFPWKRSATAITCYASMSPNPEFFAEAIELARTLAEQNPEIPSEDFISNALVAPTDSWIATVLHLGVEFIPTEVLPDITDFNECVAGFLLNR